MGSQRLLPVPLPNLPGHSTVSEVHKPGHYCLAKGDLLGNRNMTRALRGFLGSTKEDCDAFSQLVLNWKVQI